MTSSGVVPRVSLTLLFRHGVSPAQNTSGQLDWLTRKA